MKPINHRAWFWSCPWCCCVAFSAILPLMTIVNYSVQDIISPERRVFVGTEWFAAVLQDEELHGALLRQIGFSLAVLAIEIPLGILLALSMPASGWRASAVLVVIALSLLIPWNVVGTIWRVFGRTDIGLLGATLSGWGWTTTTPAATWTPGSRCWSWTCGTGRRWSRAAVLCGLRAIPDAYPGRPHRRRLAPGGVRYIQLPKMRGVLMIAVLLRFMDSFMIYTEPFVLTGGGWQRHHLPVAVPDAEGGGGSSTWVRRRRSIIYFLIILLLCFILYNWMQRAGTTGGMDEERANA